MTMKTPRRSSRSNSNPLISPAAIPLMPQSADNHASKSYPRDDELTSFLSNGDCPTPEINITPVPSVPEDLEHAAANPPGWTSLSLKLTAIIALLYFFVCSLGFLSDAFRLISGKAAGEVLQQEKLLSNPIVGVMMGILVTVAVQSSSTSTSIVVSMVASGLFTVKAAIPIIMGANLGTSVTNTVVALTHMSNRVDFERAFGGAVLHDMFNLLTVTTLIITEKLTSYLEITSTKLVELIGDGSKGGGEIQILSKLTKPFTSLIVQINKEVIIGWSINDPKYDDMRLLKVWCNSTKTILLDTAAAAAAAAANSSSTEDGVERSSFDSLNSAASENGVKCKFLFNLFNWSDLFVGLILLGVSLILLCGCLILLVKVLSSLLKGKLALAVQKGVNANIPYCPCLTGYLAIGVGGVMTLLVQSSSVFTSALTPLIAMGMISLERAYPLTLGSNLGTTTTAMLAALATEGPNLKPSIQLALCHFLFNSTGILLFYPIPWMRFPIPMAKYLGRITAKYRWFAVFYLIFSFGLLPLAVFSLSMLGEGAFYCVVGPLCLLLVGVLALNAAQKWSPSILPLYLRDWGFAPMWTRSLEPWDGWVDRLITAGRLYAPWCWACKGGVSGARTGGGTLSGGMRPNNSQVCFINGGGGLGGSSRSPSPVGYGFDNSGYMARGGGHIAVDFGRNGIH